MTSFRLRMMAQVLPFLLIAPGVAMAQAPAPTRSEAAAALNPAAEAAAASYTRPQIDQMVAPIALYPDQLLSQVLMAATYPPQIVEAAEWLKEPGHAALKGDALVVALQPLPWDPSVKSLVAFPQVIAMLSEHIEWTQTLGVAFATQQPEVMARVQVLRHLAMRSGRLKKFSHLTVREDGPAIVIAPTEPTMVFVPVYNPVVVYGEWPDRAYPPVFIPPPPSFVLTTVEPGIQVSVGYGVVAPLWGWSRPDWRGDRITVNRVEYTRITQNVQIGSGDRWQHTGPVVLAAPGTARAPAAAGSIPAGAVAPRAAAAVVALPQRAAKQPSVIQSRAEGAKPSETRAATPGITEPGKPPTATAAKPGTAMPGERKEAVTPGNTARPGQTDATPTEPGKAHSTAVAPTTHEPGVHAPATAAVKPATPAAKSGPEQAGVKGPARERSEETLRNPEHRGTEPPVRSSATPRVPEHAGSAPAGTKEPAAAAENPSQTAPMRIPEQPRREEAGAKPAPGAHQETGPAAAQHPAAPSSVVGQGSSAAPGEHAVPHTAPTPRRPEGTATHKTAEPDKSDRQER